MDRPSAPGLCRRLRSLHWTLTLAALLALAPLAACTGGGSEGGQPATTSITLTLDFSGAGTLSVRPLGDAGTQALTPTVADVQSVTVDVSQGGNALVTGAALTQDPDTGVWSITLTALPVGVPLVFTAHAYDGGPTEVFSGTTSTTLTGGSDTVTIAMAPAPPLVQALPRIVAIQTPGQMLPDGTADISFLLEGNADETLDWTVTADASGGSFAPSSDSFVLASSGSGTLTVTYTAPSLTGTYVNSVRVTNSQGNSVEATFTIEVASGTGQVILQFAPVVTAIDGSRQGTTVTWTATVVDDDPTLFYTWSADLTGESSPAFRDPSTNPALLDGYDQAVAGTLTLVVSDGVLSSTVTINLPAGQFPDTLQVFDGTGWTYQDGDGIPELTDVPTLTPSPFGPGDTVTISVPVDSDVGYLGACVLDSFAAALTLSDAFDRGCTEQWSISSGPGLMTYDLVVDGVLPASNQYWLFVIACASVSDCDTFTGTGYSSEGGSTTYYKENWVNAAIDSSADTGVAIPTYSSPGGALGFVTSDVNGIAEMTGAPTYSTTTVASGDASMTVYVPVDAEASSVCVSVGAGFNLGSGWPSGSEEGTGCASFTAGSTPTVPVTVDFSGLNTGEHSATISVGFDPPTGNANTSWNYASTKNPGTFRIVKYNATGQGTESETGVAIPTFTVQ